MADNAFDRQMDVGGVDEVLFQEMLFNELRLIAEELAKDAAVTPLTVYAQLEAYKKTSLLKCERQEGLLLSEFGETGVASMGPIRK